MEVFLIIFGIIPCNNHLIKKLSNHLRVLVLQKMQDRNMHERSSSLMCMVFSNGGISDIYSAHANEKGIMSEVHNYNIHICKHICIYIASQLWLRFLQ